MSWASEILILLSDFVINTIELIGYWGIFLLMTLESACIPIPSEVIMPFSGFLASSGIFNFWWIVFLGSLGNLVGSLLAYWVGKTGGRILIEKYGRYFLVHPSELDHAQKWFASRGEATVFFSRMLPIVRTFISLPAGIAKMNLFRFSIYTFLGAIPFNLALTYIGFVLGENWENVKKYFHGLDIIIVILLIGGVVWWIMRQIKHYKNDPPSRKASEDR